MASAGVTFATGSGQGVRVSGEDGSCCSVVWKPTPDKKAGEECDESPAAENEESDEETGEAAEEDIEEMTAALAGGEALVDEIDLTMSADFALKPETALISAQLLGSAGSSGRFADGVQFVRVSDGKGGERLLFVLGKGEEMEIEPDRTLWAFWDFPEQYNHDFFETHYLYNGYSAVWVGATQRVHVPMPSHAGAAAPIGGGGAGGGGAGVGGASGGAYASSPSLATNVVNYRNMELGYGSAAALSELSDGRLLFTSAGRAVIDLHGSWDGVSAGTFDLLSLGANDTLQLDGSDLEEGVDYLSLLGSVSLLYTDTDGSTASLDLADSANGNLSYALQMVDGTLSLVVSQKQQAARLMAGFFSSVATYAVASPVATASVATASVATASVATASADDGIMLADNETTTYTWNAGLGTTLNWGTSSAWGAQGVYVKGSPVTFISDGTDGTATTTVTLTGNVTTGTVDISGEDNFTFVLGANKLTLNNNLTQNYSGSAFTCDATNGGTLRFEGGQFVINAGKQLYVQNIEFKDVTITNIKGDAIYTSGTTFWIGDKGTFLMDGGTATFAKINASDDYKNKDTHVIFTNGATATLKRNTGTANSCLETAYLEIRSGSQLILAGEDSLKAEHILISGSKDGQNSTLSLNHPLLRPQGGFDVAGKTVYLDNTELILEDGGTLHNSSGSRMDLTGNTTATKSPTLDIVLRGPTSYLTGDWTISQINSLTLESADSYLTLGDGTKTGSLNLAPVSPFAVNLYDLSLEDGALADGYQDYTLFHLSQSTDLTLGNAALEEYVDYSAGIIGTVTAGSTNLTGNGAYSVCLFRTGNEIKLRVLDSQHKSEYTWNHGYGAELNWNGGFWNGGIYYPGSSVNFVTDGIDGSETTTVNVKSNAAAGTMVVSGEDDFTFALNGHTLTADTLTKSDSGTLAVSSGMLAVGNLAVSGGTVRFENGATLAAANGVLDIQLSGGVTLANASANRICLPGDATQDAPDIPHVSLTLIGDTSYLTGDWTISRLDSLEIRNAGLTIGNGEAGGSLDLDVANSLGFDLKIGDGLYSADRADYTIFKGNVTINGNTLAEHTDYLTAVNIKNVLGFTGEDSTTLTRNPDYNVYLIKLGDELVLRVIDKNHEPSAYTWSHTDGAAMTWSEIGWQNEAYYSGSAVSFVSDGDAAQAVADTNVTVKSDVTAGAMTVSGEDKFNMSLGGHTITVESLTKSGSGALAVSGNDTGTTKITVSGATDISGGAVSLAKKVSLETGSLAVSGTASLSLSGGTLTANSISVDNGTVTFSNSAKLALTGESVPSIHLANGAKLVNSTGSGITIGSAATLTATGTASSLVGSWTLGTDLTLNVGADGWQALTIGGGSQNSTLTINKKAFTIDLGNLWNGSGALAAPIALFTVGDKGTLKLDTTSLTSSSSERTNCLSLLSQLNVIYDGGTADLKKTSKLYTPTLSFIDGTLSLNITKVREFVWQHSDGATMTWTHDTWNQGDQSGESFSSNEHVRFTDDNDSVKDSTTVTINGVSGTDNTLTAGYFTVEGADDFTFNISGRVLLAGFTKTGSGKAVIHAADTTYRPIFKVKDGDFEVLGGTVDASTGQLEVENGNLLVDGTTDEAKLLAQFYLKDYSGAKSIHLKGNTTFKLTGAKAAAEVKNVEANSASVKLIVEKGAKLKQSGTLVVYDIAVSDGATYEAGGLIKTKTVRVADGGLLSLTQQMQRAASELANIDLVLADGAKLKNNNSNGTVLCLNGTSNNKVQLTLEGTSSELTGAWKWDASLATTLKFANFSSRALTVSGTLDIQNIGNSAMTLDLTGIWDGSTPITQCLVRQGTGGAIKFDGVALDHGDITSRFSHFYVRYGSGENDYIDLATPYGDDDSESIYRLKWVGSALYFVVDGLDADGPYIWRHSYQQKYTPDTGEEYLLTWQDNGVWRPASNTYTEGLDISAAIYKNGRGVSFEQDTDGVVDDVVVTIVGTVAPGESEDGTAGITVSGADNYRFQGKTGATDAEKAVIADWEESSSTTVTSLSKTGAGTLTIGADVSLQYSGRTEVLDGTMLIESGSWTPKGIITVAEEATLQVGTEALLYAMNSGGLTVEGTMVNNNGSIITNIVHTTGADVLGNGTWRACYYLLEHTNFHAGLVELPQLASGTSRSSFVLNDSDATISGYFAGAGQNITLMDRSSLTVEGKQGSDATRAAMEVYNAIITGEGSELSFTGGGALRTEKIDVTYGATLALSAALEHVDGKQLTFTFGYGSTLLNNTSSSIVLNPNADAAFVEILKATNEANTYAGNWKLDLSNPYELDFTYFDSSTTVVPQVVRDGTFAIVNAGKSLNENGISQFTFRADYLKYDTIEFMSLGDRGKISIDGKVLSNNLDYLGNLQSIGYWFHNGATDAAGETVWTYVDLVNKTTLENWSYDEHGLLTGTVKQLNDAEFADLTGLQQGLNFKLLFENNTLSLVIAPDGPIFDRNYYYWTGFTTNGTTGVTTPYNTWTRHNSTDLSPWMGDDIFQNGYRTIFCDADETGALVQSYTIEIENSVASGSKELADGTKAGIYFTNRSLYGYVLQSEAYNGSGCIADISEDDLTTITVQGGYVEIKTNNTYGGKLSQDETVSNYTTQVLRALVTEEESAESGLYGMTVKQALEAGLVTCSEYTYAYLDINADGTYGSDIHYVSYEEYKAAENADHRKYEQLYVTVTADGSWLVRGEVIQPTSVADLAIVYSDTSGNYTYVYYTTVDGNQVAHFVSEADFNAHRYPEGSNAHRVDLQKENGVWVPTDGSELGLTGIEVILDTSRVIGYAYYDENGKLNFTTMADYDNKVKNTQQIRLAYDEAAGCWYSPGVLLTSNEHALGTSEVLIGTGARMVANTNLYLTSLTLESGSKVEARGDLTINRELTITAKTSVEVNGKLDVAKITVQDGATFITHDVVATNITLESGATWDLNSNPQSLLDISERIKMYGCSMIEGSALIRDGWLELFSGSTENPYITINGTLKLGTNATLDFTQLAEGSGHHFRSPLLVKKDGLLVLEPRNAIMLSMDQVGHLLQDHVDGETSQTTILHKNHYMHVATLESGANFALTQVGVDGKVEDEILKRDATMDIHLAEGLGYMLDATLTRKAIESGTEAGMDEILLHLDVRLDCPAYVWDGDYFGHDAAGNDNIWSMDNGGEGRYAWSGNAVYGKPLEGNELASAYLNWGQNVYFLESGYGVVENGTPSNFHYVNDHADGATEDLDDRAKYVDIRGAVWSKTITVDVDTLYDMSADQYLRNVGYLFYSLDGTGTITDCWVDAQGVTHAISEEWHQGYTLQRTGIVKEGTGMLTLTTENSFTGDVMLNAGSIFVTNQRALGTSHVYMQDGTNLYINYTFEANGDSAYRNPVLDNEITISGGDVTVQTERNLGGDRLVSVTIGYSPISAVDALYSIIGKTSTESEESTSRHWRTLSITGALHGDAKTEIHLQGYTSYVIGNVYTSMFHIYGSEEETDFSGTIKLENYRNISPAAYYDANKSDPTKLDDTNSARGTGAVQLSISDATLQYATLDLTRQNVLAAYEKKTLTSNGKVTTSTGYGRRQTPTNILLLEGSAAVAGLNADFLGTVVRAQRDADGVVSKNQVEILVATQAYELASVRVISLGDYTFTLHSDEGNYVFSGVVGGEYAYASQGQGTIPEAGEDGSGAHISYGMISLVHTGDGTQYIHTAYLQDLTIGNALTGTYEKASGGTMGFHYLDLQGNLSMYSGSTLLLGVVDCRRTANADGSTQELHWDGSAYTGSNVTLQAGKHVNIITTSTKPLSAKARTAEEIPDGSTIDGSLTVEHGAYLDFYSHGVEPVVVEEFNSLDMVKYMTDPAYHVEVGTGGVDAPEDGYLLDITGRLVLKGDVRVDFAGVDFDSAKNGVTYYLARAQKGIIGTVTQQTISLGNGYFGIVRGLQTYNKLLDKLGLKIYGIDDIQEFTGPDLNSLTDVRVGISKVKDSTDYEFNYYTYEGETSQKNTLTLTQVSENVYQYTVGGNTYSTVLLYLTGGDEADAARLNLADLAYAEAPGYIIMTVTNTPPRVWFNQDNVQNPVPEICAEDDDGNDVMVTPDGTKFILGTKTENGAIGFGGWDVGTLWTSSSPDKGGWIDVHEAYSSGCRVQFNKYGTARYGGGEGESALYTRGAESLVYNERLKEYGLFRNPEDAASTWFGMVAMMYGEQFDIVELQGDVQARSIYVNCETGIHDAEGNLLINSPRSGYVNYWFRSAAEGEEGTIGDIEVTDQNQATISANVYDVKVGQVLAVTLEKTGGGYLRISTENSYSGGTVLRNGSLIIDNAQALGHASDRQDAGGGDGALHAFGGTTLYLNYVGEGDITTFDNAVRVYGVDTSVEGTADEARAYREGFTLTNGINLNENGKGNVHFVHVNGAVTAAEAKSGSSVVLTLAGLIVPDNENGYYRDYTVFTLANLEGYEGTVRLDSRFSGDINSIGSVAGIVDLGENVYDYVTSTRKYYREDDPSVEVDAEVVKSYYDSTNRKTVYYTEVTENEVVNRVYLTYKDVYTSVENSTTYEADRIITGGDVALRVTGNTLGSAVIDLGLNSAFHNALVLDMQKATSGTTYKLSGVSGLIGGELTQDANGGWVGYNSCVVSAKQGSGLKTVLNLNVSTGSALYAGMVGYGYYHATEGGDIGVVHASAPITLEKDGSSTQSIFSARLNGLTINQGAIQFIKDLTLSGALTIAKEAQLIIGTVSDADYTTTGGVPFSIVVQGQGILALGGAHSVEYRSDAYTSTATWSDFSTTIGAFSADTNANALLRGGTLTAVTDVSTSLTAQFADTFTIDTSHYEYEAAVLKEAGITKTDAAATTHTITLKGRLIGSGLVTVTGGGTLVLGGDKDNEFFGTSAMLFRVQDGESGGTTLSLNKDHALALLDRATGVYTGAATLEVCDYSRAVVESTIKAEIAAARFVGHGRMEVAAASGGTLATIAINENSPMLLEDGDVSGTSENHIENVEVYSQNGTDAVFTGLMDDVSANTVKNSAKVTVSSKVSASMTNLTLGSPWDNDEAAAPDNTLVALENDASLKLKNVVIETCSTVAGAASYTGVVAASSPQELVEISNTTVVTQIQTEDNPMGNLSPNAELVFTGDEAGSYAYGKAAYTYSGSSWKQDAGQVIYTLNNLRDCVITGDAGQLILKMSLTDYDALFSQINSTTLLGVYLQGVGVEADISEQLVTIQAVDASGNTVINNGSLFYVTANAAAGGTVVDTAGTVFYFIPEPSTATLSLLALAALVSRRRRRK